MYEAFYGLTERPFTTVPSGEGLYWSEGHQMAFAVLYYGIMTRAPITVVTGEIGAGKTTLIRRLLREVPEDLTIGLVSNMAQGRGELLDWVMMALGQPFGDSSYVETFMRFEEFVIQRYAEGRRVVVIVDEAQNLGPRTLEELRLLTNINSDGNELLQLILSGQPQLRELLGRPELAQFRQRISADYHLDRMTAGETEEYIAARLEAAGARRRIFTNASCSLVHEITGGLPRLINILCDLALVYGYADGRELIEEDLLREFLEAARKRGIYAQFAPSAKPLKLVPETDTGTDPRGRRAEGRTEGQQRS
jgi:type II secretory pathway predicted ATPase ExeA